MYDIEPMRAEVRILVGLGMIGAGGAGLLAMNLWTLPTMVPGPCPETPRCPPAVVTEIRPLGSSPTSAASAPAPAPTPSDASDADAAPEAGQAAIDAEAKGDGATLRASDGTEFPAIQFEERSRAPSRELMTAIQPLAAYLRGHFDMKVVLVGHGDASTTPEEYVQTGRLRAGTVLRMLVDYGVSASRIQVEQPKIEGGQVLTGGVAPGTVQASVEPRFETKKGGADVR